MRPALPSESKDHTFESCRARHFLQRDMRAGLKLQICLIRTSKRSGGKWSAGIPDSLAARKFDPKIAAADAIEFW